MARNLNNWDWRGYSWPYRKLKKKCIPTCLHFSKVTISSRLELTWFKSCFNPSLKLAWLSSNSWTFGIAVTNSKTLKFWSQCTATSLTTSSRPIILHFSFRPKKWLTKLSMVIVAILKRLILGVSMFRWNVL